MNTNALTHLTDLTLDELAMLYYVSDESRRKDIDEAMRVVSGGFKSHDFKAHRSYTTNSYTADQDARERNPSLHRSY